jgi:hypothetical protein
MKYKILSSLKNLFYKYKVKKYSRNLVVLQANAFIPLTSSIYYINLDSRIDRLKGLQTNFDEKKFPLAIRQPAVKKNNGALGCALSHIKVLESFLLESTSDLLIVAEDDCRFLIDFPGLSRLITEFNSAQDLCVFVICPSVQGLKIPISENFDVSNNIQTTACYAVKRFFVPTLLANFKEAASSLEGGSDRNQSAIDINWKKLQQRFLFAVPREKIAFQQSSYSDIENKLVNYEL